MESQSHQGLEEHIAGPCLSSEVDFMAQYTIKDIISFGGFGIVKEADHKLTGSTVAVKLVMKEHQYYELVRNEVGVMKKLHHPNIVSLIQVVETDETVYLAMELVKGQTLEDNVNQFGCMKEPHARHIFNQALSALCYCHEIGIAHRDIKPDNFMVTFKGTVKLLDFGLSTAFIPGQMVECFCGPPKYMPPESYGRRLCDPMKVDTWKLGITLYFMVTGTHPFESEHNDRLRWKIRKGIYNIPDHFPAALTDLIGQMLSTSPEQRPTPCTIKGHPWVAEGSPVRSHYDDTKPRFPDPKIMAAMAAIGITRKEVEEALQQQKYDQTHAIYTLFRARQRKNVMDITEPVDPGPTPCPSPSHPAPFPLTLKSTSSMPSLQGSCVKKRQKKETRNIRIVREHSNSQSCKETLLPPNTVPQRPLSAPCNDITQSPKGDAEETILPEGTVKEDCPLCVEAVPMPTAASRERPRRGVIWARRIWRTVKSLCCCMPCKGRLRRTP